MCEQMGEDVDMQICLYDVPVSLFQFLVYVDTLPSANSANVLC